MLASAFFASHPALSLVAALSGGVTSALAAPLVASTSSSSTILRNAQRSTTWADAIAAEKRSGSAGSFELGFSQRRTRNRHTQEGGHSKRALARRQQQQQEGSDLTAPLYNLDDARWAYDCDGLADLLCVGAPVADEPIGVPCWQIHCRHHHSRTGARGEKWPTAQRTDGRISRQLLISTCVAPLRRSSWTPEAQVRLRLLALTPRKLCGV